MPTKYINTENQTVLVGGAYATGLGPENRPLRGWGYRDRCWSGFWTQGQTSSNPLAPPQYLHLFTHAWDSFTEGQALIPVRNRPEIIDPPKRCRTVALSHTREGQGCERGSSCGRIGKFRQEPTAIWWVSKHPKGEEEGLHASLQDTSVLTQCCTEGGSHLLEVERGEFTAM